SGVDVSPAYAGPVSFEICSFCLAAVGAALSGGLFCRVHLYKQRARLDIEKLVPPSEPSGSEMDALLRRLAEWAGDIVGAPRVLIAWEDTNEPWLYLGSWDRGNFQSTRERPGSMEPLVPGELTQ